eukprot:TRINITY_DN25064_c0_g1_i1.p1 TRINITY_DN25064_c0_g1~~TRINITY_DN25064_c0_g1_i1.p1  ORF type:complete len:459 (+),score=95.21 TRINITY_DN25064_c0_g1_i1:129-1505(+)
MIRRPPRSTLSSSSAASDVYKRQANNLQLRTLPFTVGQRVNLCGESIFGAIPPEQKKQIVADAVAADRKVDRAVGSMVGMAVVDSFGHWFEFLPAVDTPYSSGHGFSLAKFTDESVAAEEAFQNPRNQFSLALGQWTDDCSMGLCMADSLIQKGEYDGSDIRQRFWNWWNNGYCNAFGKDARRSNSVGLGGNISQSLFSMEPNQVPTPRYEATGHDAGNGSLMRLAPMPVFFHRDLEAACNFSAESSYTTHPGPVAAEACKLVAYIVVRAIESEEDHSGDAAGFLDQVTNEYLELISGLDGPPLSGIHEIRELIASEQPAESTEFSWNWKDDVLGIERTIANRGRSYNGYPVSAGYWGSYCMDGLAVALWAVRHTNSFDECVERVINFLGDSDSHGSIAGQIAGAIYGYSSLHPRFVEYLNQWDDHEVGLRAVLLFHGPNATEPATEDAPAQAEAAKE